MNVWIAPVPVLSLLAASLLALFACIRIFRRERRRARELAAREVQSRLGGVDFNTSAWIVGIPRSHARRVQEKASRAAKDSGPEEVLALWEAEGGVLLGRVAGPSFSTEDEASAWVGRASDQLAEAPVAWPQARSEQSVFVLVHASAANPPARAASLRDLHGVLGPDCVGAAFVACPVDDRRRPAVSGAMEAQLASSPGTLRALSAARYGIGALAVLAGGYAAAALTSRAEGWSVPAGLGPQAKECVDAPAHGTSGVNSGPHTTSAGSTTAAFPTRLVESEAGRAGQTTTSSDTATGAEQTTTSSDSAATAGLDAAEADAGSGDAGRAADAGPSDGKGADGGSADAGKGSDGEKAIQRKPKPGTTSGQGNSGQAAPARDGDLYPN